MSRRSVGFTTRATCLLAAGATALACGIVLGERDLLRVGVLAVVVPLIAAAVVRGSQLRIGNRRSVEPVRGVAGQPVTVHLTVTNRSALPTGSLMLEDRLPSEVQGQARFVLDPLRSHESRTVSYRVPGLGRGRYRVGPLRVRLTDPFRMVDVTRSFTTASDFVIAPVVETLGGVEPPRSHDIGENAGSHSIGVHGADDASTREYRTGDDLRKIHWRSSARTGALMVRQEERPWQGQATLVLDARAEAHLRLPAVDGVDHRDTDSLEWAVSAVASIGTALLQAGRDVGLFVDPVEAERQRFSSTVRFIDTLATLAPSPQASLAGLAVPVRTALRDSIVVAVLGEIDPRSLQALADAHPRGASAAALAVLLDVDSWDPDAVPVEGEPSSAAAAAAELREAGWRVAVARRGDRLPTVWRTLAAPSLVMT
ncbi:MAG: DUF58 domain-containing protein [Jatrophihabitans sp.]|uniref:DUF58 domain-containing protein n=1 Tax=Jatrophihabitans sp. TaxID=1932789 RepID=UPI003F7FA9E2